MAISKDSPKRRKSIAVANQNKPPIVSRAKRRPHSIVSGDRLSPFAKARRSLAPRKSILKTFTNILHNDNDTPGSQQTEPSSSQPPYPHSSLDDTINQSTDITRDFHTRIQDNTSRKSIGGRRVSFAENVHVRLIENLKKDKENSLDNSQSPILPDPSDPSEQPSRMSTNENDYPGASGSRRRSVARYSLAQSEDMDMTTIGPQIFFSENDSAIMDEEFEHFDDEDAMDMTEVVRGGLTRNPSLQNGLRTPLASLPQTGESHDDLSSEGMEQSQSFEEQDSHVLSDDPDRTQPMDFTMPLSRSQRPPAEQDAVWHALRQATHSGDTPIEQEPSSDDADNGNMPYEDDGMDLDDAVKRLMRARASLPSVLAMNTPVTQPLYNDSFSTEGSFDEQHDQTMNLSTVYGRASLGGDNGRQSMGSAMDESEVYGSIAVPFHSTPRQSTSVASVPKEPTFTVFQPPSAPTSTSVETPTFQSAAPVFKPPSPSKPKTPTSTPLSPTKAKSARTGFSAAFAPPVTRPSPNKRLRPPTDNVFDPTSDKPSPPKRASLTGKWFTEPSTTSSPKSQPKPLSPSKKAPYQALVTSSTLSLRPSALRRPSGYFAKRKSFATGMQSSEVEGPPVTTSSPKKRPGVALGRASVGSGSMDAWQRFDKTQVNTGKEKEGLDREPSLQPTLTRASPDPAQPSPQPALPLNDVVPPSPRLPIVDVSALLGPDELDAGGYDNEADIDIDIDATEQWRNAVENHNFNENDDPPISIKQFFTMTGIKFMDELTVPRRSMHPSQVSQPREAEEIPLAEYVTAMGMDIPQLALYSRVSRDLEAWIEKSKADFTQAEEEAARIAPELFTEYSRADEEGQAELLHQLQLIRTNTRALAKSDWYDWKLQWLEGLRVTADQTFRSLEGDAKALESIRTPASDLLPDLRKEYEEIVEELERESSEVAEIEACNQEYLNDLKASIAEQNIVVEALRAEVAESKAKLVSLEERLRETNVEKQETKAVIEDAQRVLHIQKNGTRAEVFKLKYELESLEDLHMFRVTKVNTEMFEYVYASQFRVNVPCKNYVPMATQVDVSRVDRRLKVKDSFPRLSDFLLRMAKEQIVRGEKRTVRQIIHRLSDYWSSCAQLRAQLKLILIKFPVDVEILQSSQSESPCFKVRVMVLFPSVKAKAFISFVFASKTFSYWPVTVNSLQCEVEVAYGDIDREAIAKAVIDRLSQATPEDNYACLLDACIEAQEIYY